MGNQNLRSSLGDALMAFGQEQFKPRTLGVNPYLSGLNVGIAKFGEANKNRYEAQRTANLYKNLFGDDMTDMPMGDFRTPDEVSNYFKLFTDIKKINADVKESESKAKYYEGGGARGSGAFNNSKDPVLVGIAFRNPEAQTFADLNPEDQLIYMDYMKNKSKNPNTLYDQNYSSQSGKNQSDYEYANPIKKAEEEGKLQGQFGLAGQVEAEKTTAAATAQNLAKDVDEYGNMASKLPELITTVNQLKDLGKKATYTKVGQIADEAKRQLGLPVGEGAVARTEYTAIINNQILPLLRDTFGAQFTEREGQALRESLGDVTKSPEEKSAVLDAFINQKVKNLQSLKNKINKTTLQAQKTQPNRRPQQSQQSNKKPSYSFKTIQQAENANLPKGTIIMVNGRKAIIE